MEKTHATLWLIRHGETEWNATRRVQGHLDVPLNTQGKLQARLLAERLVDEHQRARFAALCTSDLARAKDTASVAAARAGIPLSVRPGLRERNYGVLGGLTPEEMETKHPEACSHWRTRTPDFVLPGGESLGHFNARVLGELSDIALGCLGQQVLVVTHGGVLDCAYRAALRVPLEAKREHSLHNASISRIQVSREGEFTLASWGDVAHLEAGSSALGVLALDT